MNAELIKVLVAVVAVGISLAGLMLAGWRGIRREMRDMRQEMRQEMRQDMSELRRDVRDLRQHVDTQIGNLRDRLARIEGRLDELREFFFRSGGTAA